jgi:hypothetical protein
VSEQDIRDGLRAAVWDEPPLDFDPDSLIQRAEQHTRRRRALVSVGTATAVLIATIVSLPLMFAGGGDQSVLQAASSLSTTPTSTSAKPTLAWPPPGVQRTNYDWPTLQPRMLEVWPVLSGNLQAVVGNATDIGPWKPDLKSDWHVRDTSVADVVNGPVPYSDDSGPATLDVTIAGTGAWTVKPTEICDESRWANRCEQVARRDGSVVVTVDCIQGEKACPAGMRSVYHYRLNGTVVAMTSTGDLTVDKVRRAVPLNFDQLMVLVTDPAMSLTG